MLERGVSLLRLCHQLARHRALHLVHVVLVFQDHAQRVVDGLRFEIGDQPGVAALEGGAIDVNGAGKLLATEECLLSDVQARNPGVSRRRMERALAEGWSMVLEGVHLVPGLLPAELENVLVSACVLQISDETSHAQHFFTRESGEDRPMAKYLDRFEEIRQLQRYIVGRAEREGVAVIENENANRATAAVAELVLSAAERARERV